MIFKFTPNYECRRAFSQYNSLVVIAPTKEKAIELVARKFADNGGYVKDDDDEEDREAFEKATIDEIPEGSEMIVCEDYTNG